MGGGGPGTDAEVRAEMALVWLKDAARRLYHASQIMKKHEGKKRGAR